MGILKQFQIEKIKKDRKYRRELFHQKSNTLKVLISKFSLFPPGELHRGLLRDICEVDYVLNMIKEIDYQDEIAKTKLGVDWEPFWGWELFEAFLKLPQPVSDRMILHLIESFPNLAQDIYSKLGIDIYESMNEQDLEKVKTLDQQKEDKYLKKPQKHDKVSLVSNIFVDIPDVQWRDISIIRVEENKFKFKCKKKSITYTLIELGFMDNRNKEPSDSWRLMKLFAEERGQLPGNFLYGDDRDVIVKRLSRLRKQLISICGIPPSRKNGKSIRGSPIVYNKISKTYNTEFLIRDDFTPWRNTPIFRAITTKRESHK